MFFFNNFDPIVDNYHVDLALLLTQLLAKFKQQGIIGKEYIIRSLATFTVVAGAYTSSTGTSSTVT